MFQLDLEHCLQCGGTLKLLASIEDPWIIQKILRHLDAQPEDRRTKAKLCSSSLRRKPGQ